MGRGMFAGLLAQWGGCHCCALSFSWGNPYQREKLRKNPCRRHRGPENVMCCEIPTLQAVWLQKGCVFCLAGPADNPFRTGSSKFNRCGLQCVL